jgi:hypothetical protein
VDVGIHVLLPIASKLFLILLSVHGTDWLHHRAKIESPSLKKEKKESAH